VTDANLRLRLFRGYFAVELKSMIAEGP